MHRFLIILLYMQLFYASGLRTSILLDQGPIKGLKIFPDASRTAVYAYLGIPYAQSPVGDLRFAPPLAHKGWNGTLLAMHMRPLCPQSSHTVYDETAGGTLPRETKKDEDCLYLNIWVSEAKNDDNKAVLVLITGEEMIYDWSQNRISGVDLALDDIIVVSIQYRSNIFGWISLDNVELSGNFGIQDQQLALIWIQNNIQYFGGNPSEITLLGHGTTGAPCALVHALVKTDYKQKLFTKMIIMSGGDLFGSLRTAEEVLAITNLLVTKLGCQFERPNIQLIRCLRLKSVNDLLNAFDSIYDHGNSSLRIGPILPKALNDLLNNESNILLLPPMLIGITSNEGAFLEQRWIDLACESYQSIHDYVSDILVSRILRKFNTTERNKVKYALKWFYFNGEYGDSVKNFLYTVQRLISEYFYELPFYKIINTLSFKTDVFAYIFDASYSIDMRGKVNLFGGAPHSSDLLLLLGPSMFQQITRRRFSIEEERLSRKFRATFLNFIRREITRVSNGVNSSEWPPYSKDEQFVYFISDRDKTVLMEINGILFTEFNKNSIEIDNILQNEEKNRHGDLRKTYRNEVPKFPIRNRMHYDYVHHLKRLNTFWEGFIPSIPIYDFQDTFNVPLGQRNQLMAAVADAARYRKGFFTLLSLMAVLLSVLALCVYFLHRDHVRMQRHSSVFKL